MVMSSWLCLPWARTRSLTLLLVGLRLEEQVRLLQGRHHHVAVADDLVELLRPGPGLPQGVGVTPSGRVSLPPAFSMASAVSSQSCPSPLGVLGMR
jgi:hypothetical protein